MKGRSSVYLFLIAIILLPVGFSPAFTQDSGGVAVAAVQASSFLPDDKINNRYHPIMAFDNDPLTVWSEGTYSSPVGQTISITFTEPVTVDTIEIMPGYFDAVYWAKNNRVKAATIWLDDFSTTVDFKNEMKPQITYLAGTRNFKHFTLRIDQFYSGKNYNDTCISEIKFYSSKKQIAVDIKDIIQRTLKEPSFSRMYGRGKTQTGAVYLTSEGGFVLCGTAWPNFTNDPDFWLMKSDAQGNLLWSNTFGSVEEDYANNVVATRDGGYLICGQTISRSGLRDKNILLIRTNAQGKQVWQKTFGAVYTNPDYEHRAGFYTVARGIQETRDNGFIMCGYTTAFGANSESEAIWLAKTDTQGNRLWTKTFGNADPDYGLSVQETRDGGYVVCGDTLSCGDGYDNAFLLKTDAHGKELWFKTFSGENYESLTAVRETRDGGFILCGETSSSGAGKEDIWLIRTDAQGNELWSKTFGGKESDKGKSVEETGDGGFILFGDSTSFGSSRTDALLIKTDSRGNQLWAKIYGGQKDDYAIDIKGTTDGGFIMSINSESYGLTGACTWLIKTDEFGNVAQDEPRSRDG